MRFSRRSILLAATLALLVVEPAGAQIEEEAEGAESERNKLMVTGGYTYIREAVEDEASTTEGIWVPTVGLDYRHRLNRKWLLGATAEIELANYLVVPTDLERDYALLLLLLMSHEPVERWEIYLGSGFEFETHENLFIVRFGTEYEFPLGDRGWSISPVVLFDVKETFNTLTLALTLGKWF